MSGQGTDAGKKIAGRKRHIGVDTLGLLLTVLVTAFLLEGQEIPDGNFWSRIASEITLTDLLRHGGITATDNLQHLMRAGLSTWNARVCDVAPSSVAARREAAPLH